MTRTPASVSRITWLIRSSFAWVARNSGIARLITSPMTSAMSGSTTRSSPDSGTSWRRAMMIPPTIRIGAEIMSVSAMNTTVCTCCTSFVLRVISDGAPNRFTSTWLKVCTVRKIALRNVAPEAHGHLRGPGTRRATAVTPRASVTTSIKPTDPEDVVRVALRDALVDDVAVQGRTVQVADPCTSRSARTTPSCAA